MEISQNISDLEKSGAKLWMSLLLVTDLVKDFEMDVTCTIKFHVIIIHVREHLEDEIKLRPEAPRSLGSVSMQTPESMHRCFEKYVERFHPH